MSEDNNDTLPLEQFLPLDVMGIWSQMASDATTADVGTYEHGIYLRQYYTDALYNAIPNSDPTVFKKDVELLGVQNLLPTLYDIDGGIEAAGRIGAKIGNLGDRNTQMRQDWWDYLVTMNDLLLQAKNIGIDWESGQVAPRTELGTDALAKSVFVQGRRTPAANQQYNGNNTPDLFVFKDDANTGHLQFVPYSIVSRFVYLHNRLFSSQISAVRSNRNILQIDRRGAQALIANVGRGLYLLANEIQRQDEVAEAAELAALDEEAAMIGTDTEGFVLQPLSDEEKGVLTARPEYQRYFSTTFNKDVITFVPIIQNFFLTGKYFQNVNEAFYSSNALALDILVSTIRNNDNYKKKPNLNRPPPPVPMSAQDQLDKHESSARDFILKMLIMTPINILKGLCELLDPHIGITKMIKRITGYAFDELAEVMEAPATGINTARKQMIANDPLQGEESEAYKNFRGINGDDLLKFILCLLQLSMESVGDALEDNTSIPPNFFPDIERDGIDFTGKVSGLLMVPPTPLGLIYLLLGLIKTGEEGTVDALAAPVEEEGCAPPEDPSVDLEAEENPCEPDEIP